MVHDDYPTGFDDGLHDRDGPDGVRDTTAGIADHSRICEAALENGHIERCNRS